MFVISQSVLSEYGNKRLHVLKKDFLSRYAKQHEPARVAEDVRFYVVDWEAEGTKGLINLGLNYLNNTGWQYTGGTWLAETFDDNGKTYAIAAAWWED